MQLSNSVCSLDELTCHSWKFVIRWLNKLVVCSFQFAQWFEVDHGFIVEIRWLKNS